MMKTHCSIGKTFKNWLYYHVWWIVAGVLAVIISGSMICNALDIGGAKYDYRFAYVGDNALPTQWVTQLETQIAALGSDINGDGTVTVKITQYVVGTSSGSEEALYGNTAEVALLTDITEGESYFFLTDEPEGFQRQYQLLAHMDGSPSADDDFGVWDKVYAWEDCPVLVSLVSQTSGEYSDVPQGLYFGRRCYPDPRMNSNREENAALWALLTGGAVCPGAQ